MSHLDTGLTAQSASDRFTYLYDKCCEDIKTTRSLNVGKASEVLDNIEQDLQKLETYGDKELTERYKMSLVPNLESMYHEFRYFR